MANIRWIAQSDAAWTTASAWEGGIVPTQPDHNPQFGDFGSGNCTVDIDPTCGEINFGAYSGTFNGNAKTIHCNGFVSEQATPVTGSINLTDCTVNNTGTFNGLGISDSIFTALNTRCTWNQSGTDVDWIDRYVRRFATLNFIEGSSINMSSINNSTALRFSSQVTINGRLRLGQMSYLEVYGGSPNRLTLGNNSMITGNSDSSLRTSNISMYGNASGVQVPIIFYAGSVMPGGAYNSPVTIRPIAGPSGTTTVNFESDPTFNNTLTLQRSSTYTGRLNLNATNVTCLSDVLTLNHDGAAFASLSNLTLAGTQDQTINLQTTAPVNLASNKPAGDVTMQRGDFELSADSEIVGTLTNHATLEIPANRRLITKRYIDAPTGTLFGDGTLRTESIVRI